MSSPIVTATIQACLFSASSNLIAQFIRAYKTDSAFHVEWTPIIQFVFFTILNCPPNYLWQSYIESAFPSTYLSPSKSAVTAASNSNEKELDREEETKEILEEKLNITNTLIKFLLDQTVGAIVNTLQFSLVFAGFKGANFEQAVQIARQDFWGLIFAGWKLWPLVSAVNFSVVKTVAGRNLVGCLAGVVWSVYLSLVAGES